MRMGLTILKDNKIAKINTSNDYYTMPTRTKTVSSKTTTSRRRRRRDEEDDDDDMMMDAPARENHSDSDEEDEEEEYQLPQVPLLVSTLCSE